MEDDEEIPSSHPSPADDDDDNEEIGSPRSSSPQPNGRITVTVASPAPSIPPPPSSQYSLTLALPIQKRRSTPPTSAAGGGGGGGGREDCWSEEATAVLIEAWGERFLELSRGNLKHKHWEEVAEVVAARTGGGKSAKTDVQCKNRIDTVKKKYKSEKAKIAAGGGPSTWPFFHRIEFLLGNPNPNSSAAKISPTVPVGIPVGRSIHHQKQQISPTHRFLRQDNGGSKQRKKIPVDSDSEGGGPSSESSDGLPPGTQNKRQRTEFNPDPPRPPAGNGGWGNSVRELTKAILKFGEAYEQAESAKLEQMVEMEKQRMKFAKELELQRMKFLMKTQMELSQLRRGRGGAGAGDSNHQHVKDENNVGNNSDSSN